MYGEVRAHREQLWLTLAARVFLEAGHNIPDRNVEPFMCTTRIRRSVDDARRMDLVTPRLPGVFGCWSLRARTYVLNLLLSCCVGDLIP